MKQHAIPQNILDIEFKLFTKFTVREFVYMAVGIGFGGIFLYFFTKGQLPGIIAIPVFLVSSAIGLILGLVPINDQKADVFLRNYIWAITNPTLRVWRNDKLVDKSNISEKVEEVTHGTMQRDPSQPGNAKIVGGENIGNNQFIEGEAVEKLDKDEESRLNSILKEAVNASIAPQRQQVPTQQTITDRKVETPKPTQASQSTPILISRETLKNFQTIEGGQNIVVGFQVIDKDGNPQKDSILALKSAAGSVLFAQRTDNNGMVQITKKLEKNRYKVVVQSNDKTYSNLELLTDGQPLPIIKLMLG